MSQDPGMLVGLRLTRKMDYLVSNGLLSFLLLLTVGGIFSTRGQETLMKAMVPTMVNACIGSNATIECTFNINITSAKINWYFGETSDCKDRKKIDLHSSYAYSINRYHEEKQSNASYLTIMNVNYNDSGWYCCEIILDIPRLITAFSNGCQLVIYSPTDSYSENNTTNSTTFCAPDTSTAHPWWLWVAVALSCALIITTVTITTIMCRRKKDAPLYENTKDALKRQWKEDPSLQHCMPSNGHSNKQMDTLKPHKYESHPKENSIYENTKEASRRYGRKY